MYMYGAQDIDGAGVPCLPSIHCKSCNLLKGKKGNYKRQEIKNFFSVETKNDHSLFRIFAKLKHKAKPSMIVLRKSTVCAHL